MAEHDLATVDGVRAYLAETPYASGIMLVSEGEGQSVSDGIGCEGKLKDCVKDIEPLTGGSANYVYRLWLARPFKGHNTLVLKHAKEYVKDMKDLRFETERQIYEVEALQRVRAWLTPDSMVTVPEVHFFDKDAHVIVMDDTNPESVSLKTLMKEGRVTLSDAQRIGASIGMFLGGMHKWGRENEDVRVAVQGNKQAKAMSAWVFYGRLVPTLTGKSDDTPKLLNPNLEVAEEDLGIVQEVVQETTKALLDVDDSFVMGDFWPGNLMVQLEEDGSVKRIFVIDWELTKMGLVGLDVGQFCAEIHLFGRCLGEICKETSSIVLASFMEEYKKACSPSEDDARRAVVQWGAHMVVLGARVEWGGREVSRAVVMEGLKILVEGWRRGR